MPDTKTKTQSQDNEVDMGKLIKGLLESSPYLKGAYKKAQEQGAADFEQAAQSEGGKTANDQLLKQITELAQTQFPTEERMGLVPSLLKGHGIERPYLTEPLGTSGAIQLQKLIQEQEGLPREQTKGDLDIIKSLIDLSKETPEGKESAIMQKEKEAAATAKGTARGQSEIKDLQTAQKGALGTYRFLQQFSRSYEELKKFDPDIAKEGFGGYIKRKKGKIATSLDTLPETKALNVLIQPLANGMARDIEGGRVTDQDRQIYADSFANALQNPGTTNTRLASASIISLLDKGANTTPMLKQLSNLGIDIFDDILSQVFMEYPELVEDVYGKGAKVIE